MFIKCNSFFRKSGVTDSEIEIAEANGDSDHLFEWRKYRFYLDDVSGYNEHSNPNRTTLRLKSDPNFTYTIDMTVGQLDKIIDTTRCRK